MEQGEKIGAYSIAVNLWETFFHNPYAKEDKGKGIRISEWLLSKGVDTVYSPKDFKGRGPGYVFSDAGVDVIVAPDKTLEETRRDFQHEFEK